jgi:hypothetical protein
MTAAHGPSEVWRLKLSLTNLGNGFAHAPMQADDDNHNSPHQLLPGEAVTWQCPAELIMLHELLHVDGLASSMARAQHPSPCLCIEAGGQGDRHPPPPCSLHINVVIPRRTLSNQPEVMRSHDGSSVYQACMRSAVPGSHVE